MRCGGVPRDPMQAGEKCTIRSRDSRHGASPRRDRHATLAVGIHTKTSGMKRYLCCLLAAALLLPIVVMAQDLPRPKEFYFDEDAATTRPIVAIQGSDDATVDRLLQMIARKHRVSDEARGQLAHLAMERGNLETGNALYQDGIKRAGRGSRLRDSLYWNYGWDLYRAGDFKGALEQWKNALDGRINPSWVPPTFALALWKSGQKAEATQWYAAAVRTEPTQWRDASNFTTLLPDWSDADRATLAEVLQAWRADPPAWP